MKKIQLTNGYETMVDDSDFEYLNSFKWRWNKGYAERSPRVRGTKKRIHWGMARIIMNAPPGTDVDHIDGNPLNNQRSNLRVCTHSQNLHNMKMHKDNVSGYKGASWYAPDKKWRSRIRFNYKTYFLGYFDTPEEASAAYFSGAKKLFGEFARAK